MNNSRPRLASVTKMLVVAIFWVLWCHVDVLSVPQETAECFFFGSDCFFPGYKGVSQRSLPPPRRFIASVALADRGQIQLGVLSVQHGARTLISMT